MAGTERQETISSKLTRREMLRLFGGAGLGLFFSSPEKNQKPFPTNQKTDILAQNIVYLPVVLNESYTSFENPVSGICYSPYRDGQNPDSGPYPSLEEISQDIDILNSTVFCPYYNQGPVNEIRTYGSDHGLEEIPRIILEKGSPLKINAGCWLGSNLRTNDQLIASLIEEANQFPNVTSVTVGNETQKFQTFPEEKLIEYINRVKSQIPQKVKVTSGDTWFAWLTHPALAAKVDFIQAHFFPYWEPNPIPVNEAVNFIKEKYSLLQRTYPDKKIVIGEAGWPSGGDARGPAVPSLQNHDQFLIEFVLWAIRERVSFYLFEAFDEKWKKKNEGEVGGYWGIYNSDRTRKSFCQP